MFAPAVLRTLASELGPKDGSRVKHFGFPGEQKCNKAVYALDFWGIVKQDMCRMLQLDPPSSLVSASFQHATPRGTTCLPCSRVDPDATSAAQSLNADTLSY